MMQDITIGKLTMLLLTARRALTATFSCSLNFCLGLILFTMAPASWAQADTETTIKVPASSSSADAKELPLPLKEVQTFTSVFGQIRAHYVNEVDDKTLLRNAIRGMLDGLDPHSSYLSKSDFTELQEHTTGEFGGLGLEVGMEDGFVRVISPIDDTPAQKAGVLAGDLIIKIDGNSVKGLSLSEAVAKMRGEVETDITLTIVREGSQPFDLLITRQIISVQSVRSRTLEPGFAYLRVSQFQADSGKEVAAEIEKLKNKKAGLNGIVLDLRNNPGGVLQAAVEMVNAFISDGMIVYTEGRDKKVGSKFTASGEDITAGLPLVVLINGGSASASEIVAGALQDHKRAVILGTTSFGKGSVQQVIPLSDEHAIKLTTALYFTPNGRSIQAKGITPDLLVAPATVTPLQKSPVGISEANLNRRLDNANNKKAKTKATKSRKSGKKTRWFKEDNQLSEALNVLKGISLLHKPVAVAK